MKPANPNQAGWAKIGYNSQIGLIEGDYFCGGGYQDAFNIPDPNLIMGSTLDYLNSLKGVSTTIEETTRNYMSRSFDANIPSSIGTCSAVSTAPTPYSYPGQGYDRREFIFGKSSPSYPADMNDCGGNGVRTPNGYLFLNPQISPPLASEIPGSCSTPVGCTGGMNLVSMYVNQLWLENTQSSRSTATSLFNCTLNLWTATPIAEVTGSTGGYFGSGGSCVGHTRDLLYWIIMARATGLWAENSNSKTVAGQVINEVMNHINSDGSIQVNYPGCSTNRDSGESDGLFLVAFDPRLPSWFQ